MKTRLRDLAPYWVGIAQGAMPDFYCLELCCWRQECESEAGCDLCLDRKIRWSGSAWDGQRRGIEMTARVISSVSAG